MLKAAPLPKFKLPVKTLKRAGNLVSQTTIVDRRTKEKALERERVESLEQEDLGPNTGISGLSLGLTIPGPKGSYWTARVDVSCYLPHGQSDEQAKAAIERASNIVQGVLEQEAGEVQQFFSE